MRCTVDSDCDALLAMAAATPTGCASARCDACGGICRLATRDDDGDGERAARCAGNLPISTGTDCDDQVSSINSSAREQCDGAAADENCNGMVDEGCACSTVGTQQQCCSGRGTQVCEALDGGGSVLSSCDAPVSIERCNGIDDDCNSAIDDSPVLTPDAGSIQIDGGIVFSDGGCVVGVGACTRYGTALCSRATTGCTAIAGTAGPEVCNALDDDCDGQTDEASTSLCEYAGQLCSDAGTCDCPAGQSVCGQGCAQLGGTCTAGTGACQRGGTVQCDVDGGVARCNAVAASPAVEVCDFVDNDCDGQTDEGTTVTCFADDDNDQYPTNTTPVIKCPDASRPQFGNCPLGFVIASGGNVGQLDCAPTSPAEFRLVTVRGDADQDRYCTTAAANRCIGATAPAGFTISSQCAGVDCDDNDRDRYQKMVLATDADGDEYCARDEHEYCIGSAPPAGLRAPNACRGFDCDDSNRTIYGTLVGTAIDFDRDGYCENGTAAPRCFGAVIPFPYTSSCNPTWDCNDHNQFATTTCYVVDGYVSTTSSKSCGLGPPVCETRDVNVAVGCPTGFTPVGPTRTEPSPPSSCTANGLYQVNTCCAPLQFGTVTCRVIGDCVALSL